jgi:hypothetical protein
VQARLRQRPCWVFVRRKKQRALAMVASGGWQERLLVDCAWCCGMAACGASEEAGAAAPG